LSLALNSPVLWLPLNGPFLPSSLPNNSPSVLPIRLQHLPPTSNLTESAAPQLGWQQAKGNKTNPDLKDLDSGITTVLQPSKSKHSLQ